MTFQFGNLEKQIDILFNKGDFNESELLDIICKTENLFSDILSTIKTSDRFYRKKFLPFLSSLKLDNINYINREHILNSFQELNTESVIKRYSELLSQLDILKESFLKKSEKKNTYFNSTSPNKRVYMKSSNYKVLNNTNNFKPLQNIPCVSIGNKDPVLAKNNENVKLLPFSKPINRNKPVFIHTPNINKFDEGISILKEMKT